MKLVQLLCACAVCAALLGCSAAETLAPVPAATATPDAYPTPSVPITREMALEELLDEPSADFTLETLEGGEVSLSDYRGKIVFLCFWQTWCGPCADEMPLFQEMADANEDVVVLAVNPLTGEEGTAEEAEESVRAFIRDNGFTFPVLLDRDGAVFSKDTYRSRYIPANYVIDREGVLRFAMDGSYDKNYLRLVLNYMRALDL